MTKAEEEAEFIEKAESVKKKQIYVRRPKQAKEIINRLLSRKGYSQTKSHEQLQKIWEKTVDPRMKNQTKAVGIRAGSLTIMVQNAVVNQEMAYQKKELLNKIKSSAIGGQVKNIRFKIGNF